MKKSKKSRFKVQSHIENLYELKEEYERKGDILNVKVITGMIKAKEQVLTVSRESGE
jgi:hypothetical protein